MRIALVLDDTLDRPDGVQQYVLTLGRWLAGRGHEVHYLVADTVRQDVPNIHSLGRYFSTTFNGNGVRTPLPAGRKQIAAVMAKIRPEVLHVQMPFSPFLAGRIIDEAPPATAVVGTFHVLPLGGWHLAANRALALAQRRALARFGAVMAVSEPAAEFARHTYGLTPQVVPNVVEVAKFSTAHRSGGGDGRLTVAFLGRLVERKGVLQLLRAWQALPTEVRGSARLVIGGRGPLLGQARALAGGDARVSFPGFVAEDAKPGFLAEADIACFPSTGGESFGIILVEAMAAGAGVVLGGNNPGYASVMGGQPESLVEPDDAAGFAATLGHFITDTSARQKLHAAQKQLISQYDVEQVGPKIKALYERAARSRP